MDIRDRLRELVDLSGMTQGEICERAGVSEQYFSVLLHVEGKRPSVDVLDSIASVLGVSIDEIVHPENRVLRQSELMDIVVLLESTALKLRDLMDTL